MMSAGQEIVLIRWCDKVGHVIAKFGHKFCIAIIDILQQDRTLSICSLKPSHMNVNQPEVSILTCSVSGEVTPQIPLRPPEVGRTGRIDAPSLKRSGEVRPQPQG
jgi:hypothetical protein